MLLPVVQCNCSQKEWIRTLITAPTPELAYSVLRKTFLRPPPRSALVVLRRLVQELKTLLIQTENTLILPEYKASLKLILYQLATNCRQI